MEDMEDYVEPTDIIAFTKQLKECWLCIPEVSFSSLLNIVFNGYDLTELNAEEMSEMMNEFILQNE